MSLAREMHSKNTLRGTEPTRRKVVPMKSTRIRLPPGKQMMILFALILILTPQYSFSEIPALKFDKGRCDYDSHSLSEGGSLRLGTPCVRLVCRYNKRELLVNGCPAPPNSNDPDDPPGMLYWPYCCETISG
ncbi:uncharacterized protein LOC142591116 [Dermacentor variabilis]|uniref:uncharacterized protein LOC142591116 n=1 Tax=Dermacentor variabilis TaxID=34621 RepID=UPI003F5BBC92